MTRKEIENLVGEDMEDMGLTEHFEEYSDDQVCECCGKPFEEENHPSLCLICSNKYPYY